jgi:hypothetical protein
MTGAIANSRPGGIAKGTRIQETNVALSDFVLVIGICRLCCRVS